ncbi:ComEC/Rec2 family competence protein [Alisedimentitalea sp. MJ-SS2]|uniref:ComEC/Rec2 family competence protein n=1 Tax=Aliisedimentitalea sp. MJ-SS2 TaxID=3049795 RepID=UPI00290AFD10|nr:ComEC/Rec2 family competence protein [Alisedimentitalea sp. MJ-SS2]MDU8929742.1 ComEC/Rec2 family competence protein [Alisedimentitalea sp. MJ-SS2]
MRRLAGLEMVLLRQRGHLFAWVPVFLAFGIGLYFGLGFEPGLGWLPWLTIAILLQVVATLRWRSGWVPLVWAICIGAVGFGLAMTRAHVVQHPVLGWRYYGPVEGRVIGIDRSGSGAMRVLLDQVILSKVAPDRTPERVRVSLHGEGGVALEPGARVIVTANLSPPSGPVEPSGFDFQRHAWFQKLGAVGYSRTPLLILVAPETSGGWAQWLLRARLGLSARVQAVLPGDTGAFAAAIMSGDRTGIGQETLQNLRTTNLAHLLAISGLHMGLLTGFVFAVFRLGLNLWPGLGLRVPVKKLAALMALVVAAGYLALSGGNIATERAFVMVGVALLAVVADRRVISLWAVALAAVIVLVLWPEALLGPGFQMSFAATTALVAVFRYLREAEIGLGPGWMRPIAATAISSAVAGLATAPIAAAHFNQISHFGLIANLLSVPFMGVLVIPAALLAAILLPFGLEAPALKCVGLGVDWILGVAAFVAELEGTRGAVPSPSWTVLPLFAIGALIVVIWHGRLRFVGCAPIILAMALWVLTPRPAVLVAGSGGLVGILTEKGRALSKPRGAGFVARNWLENDGDPVDQELAAARWSMVGDSWKIRHVTENSALQGLVCTAGEVVVSNKRIDGPLPCEVYDARRLRRSGALAIYPDTGKGPRIVTAREVSGERLWNQQRRRAR